MVGGFHRTTTTDYYNNPKSGNWIRLQEPEEGRAAPSTDAQTRSFLLWAPPHRRHPRKGNLISFPFFSKKNGDIFRDISLSLSFESGGRGNPSTPSIVKWPLLTSAHALWQPQNDDSIIFFSQLRRNPATEASNSAIPTRQKSTGKSPTDRRFNHKTGAKTLSHKIAFQRLASKTTTTTTTTATTKTIKKNPSAIRSNEKGTEPR